MNRWLALALSLVVLSQGCSSQNAGLEPRGEFYKKTELAEFVKDTTPPETENDYIIGVGDRLDVVFFIHRDLTTKNLLVRSDGRITLPYVGDVMAEGHTPMELDSTLSARFSEVLRDPNLSVIVGEPAEKMVYVLGQVKNSGGFEYETSLSLVQAVAKAGGFVRGAKQQHVLVIRREGLNRVVGAEISVKEITSGYNVQRDIWLRNYDIVYVPKTRLESAAELMQTVGDILGPPVDIIWRGWQIQVWQQQYELLRGPN